MSLKGTRVYSTRVYSVWLRRRGSGEEGGGWVSRALRESAVMQISTAQLENSKSYIPTIMVAYANLAN